MRKVYPCFFKTAWNGEGEAQGEARGICANPRAAGEPHDGRGAQSRKKRRFFYAPEWIKKTAEKTNDSNCFLAEGTPERGGGFRRAYLWCFRADNGIIIYPAAVIGRCQKKRKLFDDRQPEGLCCWGGDFPCQFDYNWPNIQGSDISEKTAAICKGFIIYYKPPWLFKLPRHPQIKIDISRYYI